MPKPQIAYAWFTPETFAETKRLGATDLQESFEAWRDKSERFIAKLVAQGVNVVKVEIIPADLAAWCRAKGSAIDTQNRAQFAAWILMQQHDRRH